MNWESIALVIFAGVQTLSVIAFYAWQVVLRRPKPVLVFDRVDLRGPSASPHLLVVLRLHNSGDVPITVLFVHVDYGAQTPLMIISGKAQFGLPPRETKKCKWEMLITEVDNLPHLMEQSGVMVEVYFMTGSRVRSCAFPDLPLFIDETIRRDLAIGGYTKDSKVA